MQSRYILIVRFVIGFVLVVSSIGKLMSLSLFLSDLNNYGISGVITYFSLLLISLEILVGSALVLNVYTKFFSVISMLLFIFFTIIFAFGNIFKGVENCGCFGAIEVLKTPPYLSYIRNFILIGLSLLLYLKSEKNTTKTPIWKAIILTIATGTSLSVTAHEFVYGKGSLLKEYSLVSNTVLSKYTKSKGLNAYFIFSPTCPHCIDAIENIKTYVNSGKLNHIQALSINNNDSINTEFDKEFQIPFPIKSIKIEDLIKITTKIPVFIIVRNDTILNIQEQHIKHYKSISRLYPSIFK